MLSGGETTEGARRAVRGILQISCPVCQDLISIDPIGFAWCRACEIGNTLQSHDPAVYDTAYAAAYSERADTAMGDKLAAYRCEALWRLTGTRSSVLDVGCGLGTFVLKARELGHHALGWEPMAAMRAATRLPVAWQTTPFAREAGGGSSWDVVTAFDSLEHMPDPLGFVRTLSARAWLVSVPIYPQNRELDTITSWRHWKPAEHLWFFRRGGVVRFFRAAGYRTKFIENGETKLGRQDILTLGFVRA